MNIISSNISRTILGLFLSLFIPYFIVSPITALLNPSTSLIVSVSIVVFSHIVSSFYINSLLRFPGIQSGLFIGPTILFWFAVVCCIPIILGIPFSFSFVLIALFISTLYRYAVFFIKRRYEKIKLGVIPLGKAKNISELGMVEWTELYTPDCVTPDVQALVVDLHSEKLGDDWQKFLAYLALSGVPVYNVRQVEESLTGRVKIRHMSENDLGSITPSKNYITIKHILDSAIVILSSPLTVPLLLIAMILIKLEDGGSIFFKQKRVGLGGKIFTLYKLRSMKEKNSNIETTQNDSRITKIGAFLRKSRIDEIPQFINILKGEMSLIGPRPERPELIPEIEKIVSFYQYRHIVKPGISGWAQVVHGYTVGAEETQIKVEYDFYYIKHFSFSLDVLIFIKTLRTIFTGFGAR